MSQTYQDQTLQLSSADSDTLIHTQIPLLDRSASSSKVIRDNTETFSINIHANNTNNVSAYATNIPLSNRERNNTRQSRDALKMLILITNICLIIGAVIVVLSLCITFSTVGLALFRMYLIEGYPKANVTGKYMPSGI